ncbi:MAG: type VI secretion system contractile sheath large subunit [Planctomycetota bacterium]
MTRASAPAPVSQEDPRPRCLPSEEGAILFEQILDKGRFRPDARGAAAKLVDDFLSAVQTQPLGPDEELIDRIDEILADIDQRLSNQLNEILHVPELQRLEGSWRGLHHLVMESNTGTGLQIRLINVSKKDLARDLERAPESDQSGFFKKIYEDEFGMPGGTPYGVLVGDYEFTQHPQDIDLLTRISRVAAAAWAPFISAAGPALFGMDRFDELARPRDLAKIFEGDDCIKWRQFRETEDSRWVGLCLPRTLQRLPYGEATRPVEEFRFEEDVFGDRAHDKYLWGNAAYAFATRVTDAIDRSNWPVAIRGLEGGGRVSGLPVHTFRSDSGELASKCPTEVAITDRRDRELDRLGFIPLCHYRNTDYAVFFAARSAQKPKSYDLPVAQANADLSCQLQYLLAMARFTHYLKVIQRDKLGSSLSAANVERYLNDWIAQYVLLSDEAGPELKAKQPLREARVTVTERAGQPGCYDVTLSLRPHFQLEELDVSLRLVASLDRPKRDA